MQQLSDIQKLFDYMQDNFGIKTECSKCPGTEFKVVYDEKTTIYSLECNKCGTSRTISEATITMMQNFYDKNGGKTTDDKQNV